MQWFKNLISSNEGEVKRLFKTVDVIDSFEAQHRGFSDADLRGRTDKFKARLGNGESLDSLLPEAFSVVREAMDRTIGKRHFRVQMLGGIVLHQGRIAEMKTGEGKTFVAVLPAYLNALKGDGVHIVTVNDYLAKFQGEWMAHIFNFLNMSVGILTHDVMEIERRNVYKADVTYGTNHEFGFDYLRDTLQMDELHLVQQKYTFAIIDEVDSILIDEARTPMIISGPGDAPSPLYAEVNYFVTMMKKEQDYIVNEKDNAIHLTEDGIVKTENRFSLKKARSEDDVDADADTDEINSDDSVKYFNMMHYVNNALRANYLMELNKDYVLQDNEIVIVDEFTGRLMQGRRFSEGLHQAIEAKEHVKVARENKTYATISVQNYFRKYRKLSGMTGTAKTEEAEFKGIYNLDVVQIPTNKPMIRKDQNDLIFTTVDGKYQQVVKEIKRIHETSQPILVGTVSVEKSDKLSNLLNREGIRHVVLNAKNHEKEAEIIAQAGKLGAVTIATNMAGRGTDILLGGNPEFMARRQLDKEGATEEIISKVIGHEQNVTDQVRELRAHYNDLLATYTKETDAEHAKVVKAGGLHILGTERHESRRIDDQLRGRAGRQGDPGSSQFFISLEDDLARVFGGERIKPVLARLGNLAPDEAIQAGLLTKQIESAQKSVEGRNFGMRKHLLQYDDVLNEQAQAVYDRRNEYQSMSADDLRKQVLSMLRALIEEAVDNHLPGDDFEKWNVEGLRIYLEGTVLKFDTFRKLKLADSIQKMERDEIVQLIEKQSTELYDFYSAAFEKDGQYDASRYARLQLVSTLNEHWMDQLNDMMHLREGIGLRAFAQHDPVVEYKIEGGELFKEMGRLIREDTLKLLFHKTDEAKSREETKKRSAVAGPRVPQVDKVELSAPAYARRDYEEKFSVLQKPKTAAIRQSQTPQPVRVEKKVGRNELCPCGSGLKYKNCCGRSA
ncbi:protein translocase subunit SecA 1 [Clostridia bacterium]|nr:protein translocase subunit SecA 1 [Clostridia bacterium]